MTPAVSGLLIGVLLFCSFRAGGQGPDSQNRDVAGPTPVTLTSERPTGFFPLRPETLTDARPILALTITKVVNPQQLGLGISVYLSFSPVPSSGGPKEQPRGEKILIGNFSLYPPDHPAGFRLRASEAVRQLQGAGAHAKLADVRLLIEMKRVHEKTPWAPVELVIAPPEWQQDALP
jgi:hypothetical protein